MKEKKLNLFRFSVVCFFFALIIMFLCAILVSLRERADNFEQYEQAHVLLEQGQYYKAYKEYADLEYFQDARMYRDYCGVYLLMELDQKEDAMELLAKLQELPEAKNLMKTLILEGNA